MWIKQKSVLRSRLRRAFTAIRTKEEGAEPQKQTFASGGDAREDETIQSTLLKIIERADAKTVTEVDGVSDLPS